MAKKKVISDLPTLPRGRPTIDKAIEVETRCQEAFSKGYSILKAAEEYNLAPDTVWKHFQKFKKALFANMTQDFINDQRLAKWQAIKSLEDAVEKVDVILRSSSNNMNSEDSNWHSTSLQAIKLKTDLEQQKFALDMTPTIDISPESIVEQTRTIEAIKITQTVKTEPK